MTLYAWDPNNINQAGISLSNNNRTATAIADGTDITFISDFSKSDGKIYWEIELGDITSQYQSFGVCHIDNGFTNTTRTGWSESWAWMLNGRYYHNGGYTTGGNATNYDRLMFAADIDNYRLWFGKNGTWNSGDPVAGTGAQFEDYTMASFPWYFCGTLRYTGDPCTVSFKSTQFYYDVPAGFSAAGAAFRVSGTVPAGTRVILIDEASWQIVGNTVVSGTSYEFQTSSGDKTIVALKDGKRLTGFSGLSPVGN